MRTRKGLVLDANILIRSVMGRRVRLLLEAYEDNTAFYAPDVCFDDAGKYIPSLLAERGEDSEIGSSVLEQIRLLVTPADCVHYQDWEQVARQRVSARDADDWPVAAVALLLDVPIWTEDQDFFGSGIATWTTDRVELYLRGDLSLVSERK
jgi:predicted nucleic acid-binding protein